MSTSLVSLIGLPLSIDSSTANSRERSCRIRAIRYKYLARSAPGIGPQTCSKAVRAAATARSTSALPASAILLRVSSVAGFTVSNVWPPRAGPNSPFTNNPYSGAMDTISRDSGAGAYSQPRPPRVGVRPDAGDVAPAAFLSLTAAPPWRVALSAKTPPPAVSPHCRMRPFAGYRHRFSEDWRFRSPQQGLAGATRPRARPAARDQDQHSHALAFSARRMRRLRQLE